MRFRVYLKQFDDAGQYVDDWTEITEDVDTGALADIRQVIDDDQYDVGVFKFSDFAIKLRNEHGLYSDVGELRSIFKFKRNGTRVRLTWQFQDFEPYPGVFVPGDSIVGNDEVEVFEGLLSDEASEIDVKDQIVNFKVRGLESIFTTKVVPFADISNGDTVAQIIFAALDQSAITDLLTLDIANITPAVDVPVDDVSDFENKTVKEVLDQLLALSNSVFYVKNSTMYVVSRAPSAAVIATFYGQASNIGVENIIDLTNIKSGTSKMFNFATWGDTSLVSEDTDSTGVYGVRKKEFKFESITDPGSQQDILDAYVDEFGQPKTAMTLLAPLTEELLAVNVLDKVIIDYPTVFYAQQGATVPIYGISKYGDAEYPFGTWSLTILTTDEWKIMGKSIKTKSHQIEFQLRKV